MFTFVVYGGLAVLAIASIAVMFWNDNRKRAKLHALPRTKISALVGGQRVRVVGTARKLADDVGAAYSGTVCLACKCWVSTSADVPTPDDVVRVVSFRVEDETGSIDVAVEHTRLELTGEMIDLAAGKAFGASIIARETGGASMTYWEDRLLPDSRVAVIGIVVRDDAGANRLCGREQEPLVIANVEAALVD